VNRRQQLALAAPLNRASDDLSGLREQRQHATGVHLVTILAVDR